MSCLFCITLFDLCVGLYYFPVAVIGFVSENYLVAEGIDSSVNLTVELISGQLGQEVVVVLNTPSDGTATSESFGSYIHMLRLLRLIPDGLDFIGISNHHLTFGPIVSSRVVSIEIINDALFEEEFENFSVTLSTDETCLLYTSPSPRDATLSRMPSSA